MPEIKIGDIVKADKWQPGLVLKVVDINNRGTASLVDICSDTGYEFHIHTDWLRVAEPEELI